MLALPTQIPLWRAISEKLRERITNGFYNDAFPGELKLSQEFEVSRGTIRAALHPLREAGLITGARGKQPSIAQVSESSRYGAIYSLQELIVESGADHESRVLSQGFTTDQEAAERFAVDPESGFFRLERVRYANGSPIAYDVIFSPAHLAQNLRDVDFSDTAFYAQLRDHCGITIQGGTEHLQAVPASNELAALLDCQANSPLLLAERIATSASEIVEFRRTFFRGDRFKSTRLFGSPIDPAISLE